MVGKLTDSIRTSSPSTKG